MRELLFILIVVLVILGLTAIRYRKHIASLIGFARVLKEVKENAAKGIEPSNSKSTELASCVECGVWIPRSKVISKDGRSYCSSECHRKARVVS